MVCLYGYHPPEKFLWQGRHDGTEALRMHEIVHCTDIQFGLALPKNAFVLIGFASDEGVRRNQGRIGAAEGPLAWRKALANMPIPEDVTRAIVDVGDITCLEGDLEKAQEALGCLVALILEQGGFPFVCGGGSEVVWGHFQGIAKQGFDHGLGIVNLDANYGLEPIGKQCYSETSFTQILEHQQAKHYPFYYACAGMQPLSNTLLQHRKAKELDVLVIEAEEIENAAHTLHPFLDLSQHVYLNVCLDVFNAAFAPGVVSPQVLGITPQQGIHFVKEFVRSGELLTCSITGLSPPHDRDQMTARLAALLTLEILKSDIYE